MFLKNGLKSKLKSMNIVFREEGDKEEEIIEKKRDKNQNKRNKKGYELNI